MKITLVNINSLNPAEYNPRQISNKQYEDLKASMEKFGCVDPIIININPDRQNVVVGGHQRLRILRELGAEKVPTVSVNLSQEDERELNVRLNKNGGEWDMDLLSNFDVVDLKEWGFKDIELGFNIDKIDEDKPITITVKEDDAVLANELYEDLKGKGYKVTKINLIK
jgi:ParB-like chromosome segregation protein Spo0J